MSPKQISKPEIALHWIVGLGMIGLIALGLYMGENRVFDLYPIHKSLGLLLLPIILLRAVIRLRKGWPENVGSGPRWQHRAARLVHWVLILGTLALPLSGMMDSLMAGRGLSLFGLDLLAANLGADGRPEAISAALSDIASAVHGIAGKVLIGAIALHVAGAVKHQTVDRDGTLARMLGRA